MSPPPTVCVVIFAFLKSTTYKPYYSGSENVRGVDASSKTQRDGRHHNVVGTVVVKQCDSSFEKC